MSANPSGAEPTIVPFWNRLREVTLYPAHGAALATIVVLALAKLVVFLPFGWLLSLLVAVAMYKYAFECLRATANGRLTPPEIVTQDDASLGWRMIRLTAIFIVVAVLGLVYFKPVVAVIWLCFLGLSFPAATMTLAMNENMVDALNPGQWLSIMGRIGWPYVAVVLLCLVTILSQGYGASIVGRMLPLPAAIVAVTLISNYGLVVMFHLMGYLIYQYHDEVGFVPETPQLTQKLVKADPDQEILDQATAMVREGRPEDAQMLLRGRLRASGGTPAVHTQYRKLLTLAGDKDELIKHGQEYLGVLLAQDKDKLALDLLRECQAIDPNFAPREPSLVSHLAEKAAKFGQPQVALKLLGGFHKRFPKSKDTPKNYLLAATLMHERLNQDEQACALLRSLQSTYPNDPMMPEIDAKLAEIQRMMAATKPVAKTPKPVTPA